MTQNEWVDISAESYRTYLYESGYQLRIDAPSELRVAVSTLGGHCHRVKTLNGEAYYIAPGWRAITWKARKGERLFKY